jgi:hypothetical protein
MTDSLLPLPISPAEAQGLISQALAMLPTKMDSANARTMMTAICLQESNLAARRQHGNGPARGLPQFERTGGVRGVMTHDASEDLARHVCGVRGVPFNAADVWAAMELDDVLSLALTRLLLWTDPKRLPDMDEFIDPAHHVDADDPQASASWKLYYRVWRPGKPHPAKWPGNYAKAVAAVRMAQDAQGAA